MKNYNQCFIAVNGDIINSKQLKQSIYQSINTIKNKQV